MPRPARDRSRTTRRYAVVRDDAGPLRPLRTALGFGEEALAVFSSAEAAERFSAHEAPRGRWRIGSYSPAELIAMLLGPCSDVEWVLSDPSPGHLRSGVPPTELWQWSDFVDDLLG